MRNRIPKVLIGVLMLVLISCSSDDSSGDDQSYMSATIGGDFWESTDHTSTLTHIPSLSMQRYDLTGKDENYQVGMILFEEQITDCMTSKTYDDFPNKIVMLFYYGVGNDNFVSEHSNTVITDPSIESDIRVTVTSCSDGMISGTFSGTYYKVGDLSGLDTPEIVTITNGVFNNIPFTVQEL
ncbi:hypothetical protein [Aquimarina sp. 2201CG5-10]|uniref:hypothetical protein n=1 Tax=Aquimarina callyspongiae TaxID=3098150 RepID=UPI002AB4EF64|nr:hypothetical protein [Aquimarina sp. 2201CG5-10]MDY8138488.1 hypothetical protein [Aquimarina sp. 2201CG5-10]